MGEAASRARRPPGLAGALRPMPTLRVSAVSPRPPVVDERKDVATRQAPASPRDGGPPSQLGPVSKEIVGRRGGVAHLDAGRGAVDGARASPRSYPSRAGSGPMSGRAQILDAEIPAINRDRARFLAPHLRRPADARSAADLDRAHRSTAPRGLGERHPFDGDAVHQAPVTWVVR